MNNLSKLRKNIDACDRQLVNILSNRFSLVKKVALYKKENNIKPLDSARWQKVIDKVVALSVKKKVSPALIKSIFDYIHQESLAIEGIEQGLPLLSLPQPLSLKTDDKISFLGPLGTYSHMAAEKIFNSDIFFSKDSLVPKNNIVDVFESVQKGEIAYGVVPAENSTEGIVKDTIRMFALYNVSIAKKYFLPIDHSLLTLNPVKNITQIKKVKAHPQALGQCRKWLKKNIPNALLDPTNSNVSGVYDLKTNEAVIASKNSASMYGLSVVAKNISDNPNNTTMFYVIKKEH